MRRRAMIFSIALLLILLSINHRSNAEDLPTLHDRVITTLYGPGYRQLFLGQKSVPAWIRQYNATLKGTETPGLRVYFDGAFFERYKICDPAKCDDTYMIVLFTPGGREAWAVAVSGGQQQFFGYPDPVMQRHLIAAEKQP
jgi:hypothetical protein